MKREEFRRKILEMPDSAEMMDDEIDPFEGDEEKPSYTGQSIFCKREDNTSDASRSVRHRRPDDPLLFMTDSSHDSTVGHIFKVTSSPPINND